VDAPNWPGTPAISCYVFLRELSPGRLGIEALSAGAFTVGVTSGWLAFACLCLCVSASCVPVHADAADDAVPQRLELLSKLVRDPVPSVRLEALRALAKIPSARAAELALGVLEQPMDPTLDYALWLTINDLADPWIAALQSGAWKPDGREKQLEFALRALPPEKSSRVLGQILSARPLSPDGAGPWIELIGAAGGATEIDQLLAKVTGRGFDEAASVRALNTLRSAAVSRKLPAPAGIDGLAGLLEHPAESVRAGALRLGAVWKPALGADRIGRLLANESSPTVRTAALDALRQLGGKDSADLLANLASGSADEALGRQAALALAGIDLTRAIPTLAIAAGRLKDETVAQDFWRALLPIKGAGNAMAAALPKTGLDPACARVGMRVAREGGRSDLELVSALIAASGIATDGRAASEQLIRDLAARAATGGDPARGEMIYRRTELACMTCHAIGGAGGRVGPDLTSIGASAPGDYLVESLLLPNAKIKEGYLWRAKTPPTWCSATPRTRRS
jgi:HEAT repeat protein/cytochrome c551/c552